MKIEEMTANNSSTSSTNVEDILKKETESLNKKKDDFILKHIDIVDSVPSALFGFIRLDLDILNKGTEEQKTEVLRRLRSYQIELTEHYRTLRECSVEFQRTVGALQSAMSILSVLDRNIEPVEKR